MKIVINTTSCGLSLSFSAFSKLTLTKLGIVYSFFTDKGKEIPPEGFDAIILSEMPRNDPDLVATVEEMGAEGASGKGACLKVIEIPDGSQFAIICDGGYEQIGWRPAD